MGTKTCGDGTGGPSGTEVAEGLCQDQLARLFVICVRQTPWSNVKAVGMTTRDATVLLAGDSGPDLLRGVEHKSAERGFGF